MQPNGNIPGTMGRPVAGAPVSNVNTKPAPTSTTVPVPKPAEPTFGNGGSVVEGKGGKKTGWILGIVVLLLIAAGGVGFGVWAYMDGNAQKDALNSQISALKQQNNDLQDKLDNGDDTIKDIDTDGNEVNTADYIYVGEWGLKIKIPENLEDVSYYVRNWDEDQFAGTSLCVSGASTGHSGQIPSFVKPVDFNQTLKVCLSKNTKSLSEEDGGEMYQTIPVGQFYIVGPQAIVGDGTDEDWEVESADAIRAMLENENNRSAI